MKVTSNYMKSLSVIQLRLVRNLLLVILAMAGAIVLLVTYVYNVDKKEYSATAISNVTKKVAVDIEQGIQPFATSLKILKKWALSDSLQLDKGEIQNVEQLNALLIPILEQLGSDNTLHLAISNGSAYLLLRQDDHWLTRLVNVEEWGRRQKWQLWQDSGEVAKTWWSENDYDPRSTRWYIKSLPVESDEPVWTEPYFCDYSKKSISTGSIQWQKDGNSYVAAFDVPLCEFYATISRIKTTSNGLVFLANNKGLVFYPRDADASGGTVAVGSKVFIPPAQVSNSAIAEATKRWNQQRSKVDKADHVSRLREPFYFKIDGQGWWAGFAPLDDSDNPTIWAGIVVPQSDFFGAATQRNTVLSLVLLALVVGGGGWGIVLLVRRYAGQNGSGSAGDAAGSGIESVEQLQQQLAQLILQGEGFTREFKSTMRTNLRENKPDRGIELAWLKAVVAFLNSSGGMLFIGVADDGTILGLGADNFANDDKCHLHFKNLLNQYIGLEYSRHIQMNLLTCEGKTIAIVQCKKAQVPVFLKNKNDEEFYIRSGPSSTKLTGSKLLQYLQQGQGKEA